MFWKDVIYGNIKNNKKPGIHPLFRRHIFRKTTGWVKLTPPPPPSLPPSRLGLNLIYILIKNFKALRYIYNIVSVPVIDVKWCHANVISPQIHVIPWSGFIFKPHALNSDNKNLSIFVRLSFFLLNSLPIWHVM